MHAKGPTAAEENLSWAVFSAAADIAQGEQLKFPMGVIPNNSEKILKVHPKLCLVIVHCVLMYNMKWKDMIHNAIDRKCFQNLL